MYFIFDLETTHSNKCIPSSSYKFKSSRIVSISWLVLDSNFDELVRKYYIVKPVQFRVSRISTLIHGITHKQAQEGSSLEQVLSELHTHLQTFRCSTMIAHNLNYDVNILMNEFFRLDHQHPCLNTINNIKLFCTMKHGKQVMKQKKNPKLCELYSYLFDTTVTNAHHALTDTILCSKCFVRLSSKSRVI